MCGGVGRIFCDCSRVTWPAARGFSFIGKQETIVLVVFVSRRSKISSQLFSGKDRTISCVLLSASALKKMALCWCFTVIFFFFFFAWQNPPPLHPSTHPSPISASRCARGSNLILGAEGGLSPKTSVPEGSVKTLEGGYRVGSPVPHHTPAALRAWGRSTCLPTQIPPDWV